MIAQYIATQPFLDLCERSVWRPGFWVSWKWWEQERIDIEGSKERAVAESDKEEDKCGEGATQEETTGQECRRDILRY